jgi:hypothetical protein
MRRTSGLIVFAGMTLSCIAPPTAPPVLEAIASWSFQLVPAKPGCPETTMALHVTQGAQLSENAYAFVGTWDIGSHIDVGQATGLVELGTGVMETSLWTIPLTRGAELRGTLGEGYAIAGTLTDPKLGYEITIENHACTWNVTGAPKP